MARLLAQEAAPATSRNSVVLSAPPMAKAREKERMPMPSEVLHRLK